MKYFDVFNGDADGICALHQMRLANPIDAELITGIKRDIELVKKVNANSGDHVLVLDVSLAKNIEAVNTLLKMKCNIKYFDHHLSGEVASNNLFENFINTSPDTCTSLLVNEYLNEQYVLWAIVGAYGDNMLSSANDLADKYKLTENQKNILRELGICLNYNGYGLSLDDLYFKPDELYLSIKPFDNPFYFIKKENTYKVLKNGYRNDMNKTETLSPNYEGGNIAVYELPNQKWSRRVIGVFGNKLSNEFPDRAHALLIEIENGVYQVSVRAPQNNKLNAGTLCSKFKTGGGREGAAGINRLLASDKQNFIDAFNNQYPVS